MLRRSTDRFLESSGVTTLKLDTRFFCLLLLVAVFAMDAASAGKPSSPGPMQPGTAQLDLQIRDEMGQPVFARVRLWTASGEAPPIEVIEPAEPVAIHPRQPDLGVVLPGRGKIRLAPGAHTLRVERGTEYQPIELQFQVKAGDRLSETVQLRRWANMSTRGWWSGDTHVHRVQEDMEAIMKAADLHLAPTITHWNDNSSLEHWPQDPLYVLPGDRAYSVNNSEDERQWGAALFSNLDAPVQLYSWEQHTEYPGPVTTWQAARRLNGHIDLEKLTWWEAPVIATLMRPDTVGLANNHFHEEGMMDREAWGRPRDSDKYPGQAGFTNYILDLYYIYLNAGFRLPASAGSANGVLRNPIGYNRSYVYLESGFSYAAWFKGQKAGRNFVTNGPMLLVQVNDHLPGTVLPSDTDEVEVQIEARAARNLQRIDIVVDAEIVETFQPAATAFMTTVRVPVRDGGWLAVRAFEEHPRTVRFAHTGPFYIGDEPRRGAEALAYLRTWIEAEIERLKRVPDNQLTRDQRDELIENCAKALQLLR